METQYQKMPYVHTRLKEKFCYRKMTVAAFIYKMNMENSKDNHGRIAPAEMLVMDMIRSCEETLETQLFLAGANTDTPSEFEARLHRNCPNFVSTLLPFLPHCISGSPKVGLRPTHHHSFIQAS